MSETAFRAKVERVAEQATVVAGMLSQSNWPDLQIDARLLEAALKVAEALPGRAEALTNRQALKSIHAEFFAIHSANLGADGDPDLLQLDRGLEILLGRLTAVVDSNDADWAELAPDDPGFLIAAAPHAAELIDLRQRLDATIAAKQALEDRIDALHLDLVEASSKADGPIWTLSPLPPFVSVSLSTAKIKELVGRMLLSGEQLSQNRLGAATSEVKYALDAYEIAVDRGRNALARYNGLLEQATDVIDRSRTVFAAVETFVKTAFATSTVASASPNPWRDLHVFRDGDEPWCPEMVVIPGGSFVMGSPEDEPGRRDNEGPRVRVEVAKFALGVYAVTFDEYDPFCRDTGRPEVRDAGWGRGRQPAIGIWWQDASDYCAWLSDKTGTAYRLPSEAEWEYACRAGSDTPFWWGDAISSDHANCDATWPYNGGEQGERLGRAVPVDRYGPSPWKLYQTHGNVMEWCADRWVGSHEGRSRYGHAPADRQDSERDLWVLRGGCWFSRPEALRSAARSVGGPDSRYNGIGFRVARTLAA